MEQELSPEIIQILKQKVKEKENRHRKIAGPFILPALVLVTLWLIYPAFYNIILAFFEWDMQSSPKFVGIDNFITIFQGPEIKRIIINTLLWCTLGVFIPFLVALLISSLIQGLKGEEIFKTIFFLPRLLSGVSAAALWGVILSGKGTLNQLLEMVGKEEWTRTWLAVEWVNTGALIFAASWSSIGINIVLLLLGFAAIPKDPIEAAKIDGISSWKIYWDIMLPLLIPTCLIVTLLLFIGAFSGFDFIWAMTRGGPYRTTETLAVTMYREGFLLIRLGIGAAVAVILGVITIYVTYWQVKIQKKYQVRY